jgi:hypothetical protein
MSYELIEPERRNGNEKSQDKKIEICSFNTFRRRGK